MEKGKMNEVYSFYVDKMVERDVQEETEQGTLTRKVKQKEPVKVIFKRPNRLEVEEADMVYAVEYGKCVRAGILTRPLIEKLYDEKDKSGILSDDFSGKYMGLLQEFWDVQNAYTKLQLKSEKTEEDENKMSQLAARFGKIKNELQGLESTRNSLFEHTAENKAQKKTIVWLTLYLTYVDEDNGKGPFSFFKGSSFEEKMAEYENLIDKDDEFTLKLVDKMSFFVSLWYMGRASSKEDFIQIEKNLDEENKEQEEVKTEEKLPEVNDEVETPVEAPSE